MAKVIGRIPKVEIRKRIHRSRSLKYGKPLRVKLGDKLREALDGRDTVYTAR